MRLHGSNEPQTNLCRAHTAKIALQDTAANGSQGWTRGCVQEPTQKHTLSCECTRGSLQLPCRAKQTYLEQHIAWGSGGWRAEESGRVRWVSPVQDLFSALYTSCIQTLCSCGPGLLFGPLYALKTSVIWYHWSHRAEHLTVFVQLISHLKSYHFSCLFFLVAQVKQLDRQVRRLDRQAAGQACCGLFLLLLLLLRNTFSFTFGAAAAEL